MPNVSLCIYLNAKEYTKYLKLKKEYNKVGREAFKKRLKQD